MNENTKLQLAGLIVRLKVTDAELSTVWYLIRRHYQALSRIHPPELPLFNRDLPHIFRETVEMVRLGEHTDLDEPIYCEPSRWSFVTYHTPKDTTTICPQYALRKRKTYPREPDRKTV